MQWKKALVMSAVYLCSGAAIADMPEQYETVEELMEAHQDYTAANHTFHMWFPQYPRFRLSSLTTANEPESVTYYNNWRAAAYGIYDVFAHTSIPRVTVTAVPYREASSEKADDDDFLNDYSILIQIDRDQALDALSGLIDVDSLTAVKTKTEQGWEWSEDFLDVYYEDRSPGLDALIAELKPYCNNACE
ncbi:hypothetical protein ACGLWX_17055 [Halomonas sp. HMF6819]|uniref:hypothetical protein n=1 Tax=Halomonas sp. HMF6819 TaxID=3373085 RepID=UPI0037AAE56A